MFNIGFSLKVSELWWEANIEKSSKIALFFQILFPSVSRQGGCNNLFLRNSEKDQRTNKSNAELLPIFVFSTIA